MTSMKQIDKYVDRFVNALFKNKVGMPSSGDCWFCAFRVNGEDATLGEKANDASHIQAHIKENYFVPSLLSRAIEVFKVSGMTNMIVGKIWAGVSLEYIEQHIDTAKTEIRSSLKNYILKSLNLVDKT